MHFRGTERFRLSKHLGSGSFGSVYEADDLELGRPVALKVLDRVNPDSLIRFKREFRSLADFRHRNVVSLYELLSDGANWFYTMELVRGSELLEYLARQEILRALEADITFSPARALTEAYVRDVRVALMQLVDAIAAVHAFGKLHRDVKPTNILVTDDGRVVLLDFGLVRELEKFDGDDTASSLVGTPGYMSPEQVAGGALGEAADWYSFGVVLYQALTGTLPFTGSFFEISVAQRTRDVRPPSALVAGIPPDLDELCQRLLRRVPEERPTAGEIRRLVAPGELTYWLPPFRSRRLGHDRSFVGRRQYLDLLSMFMRESAGGRPRAVFLHGSSGVGKTALVNAFLDQVRATSNAFILATRCYERELVPYRALDGIVDSLARIFSTMQLPLGRFTDTEINVACAAFPILRQVTSFEILRGPHATMPADQPHAVLALFFSKALAILAAERPAILFIDDAQWGDLDSGRLLANIFRVKPPDALIVLSYTSEDFATSLLLQTFRPEQGDARFVVELQPLDRDEARDLVLSSVGRTRIDDDLIESILEQARGNGFFLEELIAHVKEHDIRGGKVSLATVLSGRFAALSDRARALVGLVASAGAPVNADWVRSTLGLDKFGGDEFLLLRSQRWIRSRFTGELEEVEIYHSRLRDFVLEFNARSSRVTPAAPDHEQAQM